MPKLTEKQFKNKAKKLKKAGIINFDLRKKLNNGQKAAISRQFTAFSKVLDKDYTRRSVSKAKAKKFKKAGYHVHNNRVWLPTDGFDSKNIKIKTNSVDYGGPKAHKRRIVQLTTGEDFLPKLKALSNKKLKKNEFVTVQIGDDNPFWTLFTSYEDLLNYIAAWNPDDHDDMRDELIAKMSITSFFQEIPQRAKKKRRDKNPRGI